MRPGIKLTVGSALLAATIGYLAFVGAASTWQFYLTVDEVAAEASRLSGKRIRVSGRVHSGTLTIAEDRRRATFMLLGETSVLLATCHCMLPDNLVENIDVVVEGTLHDDGIHGHKVITQCASKYEPEKPAMAQRSVADRSIARGSPHSSLLSIVPPLSL